MAAVEVDAGPSQIAGVAGPESPSGRIGGVHQRGAAWQPIERLMEATPLLAGGLGVVIGRVEVGVDALPSLGIGEQIAAAAARVSASFQGSPRGPFRYRSRRGTARSRERARREAAEIADGGPGGDRLQELHLFGGQGA